MFKKILIIFGIILIAGISGVVTDHYLFPRLSVMSFFSKYDFLKKTNENTTIINKTEQVYIKEDSSINKITNQIAPSVVNIISYNLDGKRQNFKNGTGLIVTSDGIIMSYNSAIILGKYKVMTNDGNAYDGELLGIDSWSNLVFIKINASNLPVASFGNSDEYKAGEKLIAISNDLSEYQNRFNAGLLNSFDATFNISGEALSTAEKLEGVFLSDFNEEFLTVGSPVVDYSGQIIGLTGSVVKNNMVKYFQIPSNKIKDSIDKIINKSSESNPSLGVYYISINKSYSLINNLSVSNGAIIYSESGQQGLAVIAGSPADKAGLKIGDIIIKIGDRNVDLSNNLSVILNKHKKGDAVDFTVLRAGKEVKISVQL